MDSGIDFDLLFGPAYKGIPIATTTAVALAEHHERDVPTALTARKPRPTARVVRWSAARCRGV